MKLILIVYHSQEKGNTARMAELVEQGCKQVAGVEVRSVNVCGQRVDMDLAGRADAYALGSPDYFTYMAGGLKQFFDDLCIAGRAGKNVLEKPYAAFMTHGGGGDGIKSIERCAKSLKLVRAVPSVLCQGSPHGAAILQSIELGRALAQSITGETPSP
jgi:multimeric flavodoxin WrbA